MKISIANDFSKTPGFRHITDGPFSGELFRKNILDPAFAKLGKKEKIEIDLDRVAGYATSFLEEAFGGLARDHGIDDVLDKMIFICVDEPLLIDEIKAYIRNSKNEKK
jgi:hypothetical protein